MQVGNYYMSAASNAQVTGTLTNTGTVQVNAGNVAGANSTLTVTGAAPATLTGTYQVNAYSSSAAIKWGSGGIASIGNGSSSAGTVQLSGALGYLEIGATNSNSALTGLTTIAGNGDLELANGTVVNTTGALTNSGSLRIDTSGAGGSTFTSSGALTNNSFLQIGYSFSASPSTLNAGAALTNGSAATLLLQQSVRCDMTTIRLPAARAVAV